MKKEEGEGMWEKKRQKYRSTRWCELNLLGTCSWVSLSVKKSKYSGTEVLFSTRENHRERASEDSRSLGPI